MRASVLKKYCFITRWNQSVQNKSIKKQGVSNLLTGIVSLSKQAFTFICHLFECWKFEDFQLFFRRVGTKVLQCN